MEKILDKLADWIDKFWGMVSHPIFVRFEFDMHVERLKDYQKRGKIIFALTNGGLVEWLILSSWCRTQGLGAILVSNRLKILLLAKPLYFLQRLFGTKKYSELFLNQEPGPRVIFCPAHERKKLFVPTPLESLLAEFYVGAKAQGTLDQYVVIPVFIRWRKYLRSETRNPSEYLFGWSSNPNVLGKFWYLIRKRRDSTVNTLDPVLFTREGSTEQTDVIEENESLKIARAVRRKILVLVNQEMRVVLGSRYYSPHSVKETLMRDPDIQKLITEMAEKNGVDRKKVMLEAYQYMTEIFANYKYRFIEIMAAMLSWLFNKVFDGLVIDKDQLQKVREVMKTKPIVFVPCHRSHLDYLVIPYVLFEEDMVTPHIVAGVNLAFWPAGILLRMGGAFFIRRSFRGNALYSMCLRKYIEYLLKNRVNLKFFIEGTRSRSGKMLPPAYGILKMILEAYDLGAVDDVALIPVSIVYDEVLEQGSYTKELKGGKKESESAAALIKSSKVVKKNIGKVYVRCADPIYAKQIYSTARETGMDQKLMLQKTAFEISKAINDASPVTAKAIVCSVLLTHRAGSLPLEDILRHALDLAEYVRSTEIPLSVPLENGDFRRAAEQMLRRLQKSSLVGYSDSVPRGYFCDHQKRIVLNFYKNNGLHCLAIPSITLLALFDVARTIDSETSGVKMWERFHDSVLRIRNLLKFELFFSPTPVFLKEVLSTLNYFSGDKNADQETWLNRTGGEWLVAIGEHFQSLDDTSIYTGLVGELLEAYLTAGNFLKSQEGHRAEKKSLASRLVKHGESLITTGGLFFPESNSTQNYSNALLMYENLGVIQSEKDGDKQFVRVIQWNSDLEKTLKEFEDILQIVEESPAHFFKVREARQV